MNVPHVVSVPEERLREKGVKAYSDQLQNAQQSKVDLPKFPTYFELFGDPGTEIISSLILEMFFV